LKSYLDDGIQFGKLEQLNGQKNALLISVKMCDPQDFHGTLEHRAVGRPTSRNGQSVVRGEKKTTRASNGRSVDLNILWNPGSKTGHGSRPYGESSASKDSPLPQAEGATR